MDKLPADLRLGPIHLTSRDPAQMLSFYRDLLGLELMAEEEGNSWLGAGERPLVVLRENPEAPRKPARTTGLYHFALMLPDRPSLGWALRSLLEAKYPLQGAADHSVSEAVYLPDPDGNGIELYRDRPRADWHRPEGQLYITTEPLDYDGVMSAGEGGQGPAVPSGSVMGHVHLHVADLQRAEEFYGEALGFELVTRYGNQASFYATSGYHHHIGLNTWAGVGAPTPPAGAVGLHHFTVVLESAAELGALADRLKEMGIARESGPGWIGLQDSSSNRLKFELESNQELP